MTADEAKRIVAYVAAAWPGPPWAEVSLRIWVKEIMDLPADAGMEGARQMVRETAKFPSVAELRQNAAAFMRRQEGERGRQALLEDHSGPSPEDREIAQAAFADLLADLKARKGMKAAKGGRPNRFLDARRDRGEGRA